MCSDMLQNRTNLQEGRALLVLLHLGGQVVELHSHAAQVGQQLVGVGLLCKDAEGALQPLQLAGKLHVVLGQQRHHAQRRRRLEVIIINTGQEVSPLGSALLVGRGSIPFKVSGTTGKLRRFCTFFQQCYVKPNHSTTRDQQNNSNIRISKILKIMSSR